MESELSILRPPEVNAQWVIIWRFESECSDPDAFVICIEGQAPGHMMSPGPYYVLSVARDFVV